METLPPAHAVDLLHDGVIVERVAEVIAAKRIDPMSLHLDVDAKTIPSLPFVVVDPMMGDQFDPFYAQLGFDVRRVPAHARTTPRVQK